jgi:hypothetical protein
MVTFGPLSGALICGSVSIGLPPTDGLAGRDCACASTCIPLAAIAASRRVHVLPYPSFIGFSSYAVLVLRTRRLAGLVAIAYVWLDAYCHAYMYYVTCSVELEHRLQKRGARDEADC